MSRLVVSTLGPVSVLLDGAPVNLPAKAVALLAYLAVESGRAHRREKLAALLWPDSPEARARHNLRQLLTVLRQALRLDENGAPFFRMTRGTVAFDRHSDHRLDLHEMTAPRECPRDEEGRKSCRGGCLARTALYRGPFLEDVSVAENETFTHWLVARREMIECQAAQLLERLYDCWAGEDRRTALSVLRRQLELDPWNENVHRELMRAWALNGEANAALRHFESFSQRIRAELGVAPEDETQALYDVIRAKRMRLRKRPKVVVVDGDPSARLKTAAFLRQEGYEVREARGAAEGRAILDGATADVVLIDPVLPDGDGFALAAALRRASDVGIVFASARASLRDRIRGFDLGGDHYLTKPVHLPELAACLRSVLRRRGF